MKFSNRLKRLTDILEKLGLAGAAIGLFQSNPKGLWLGLGLLAVSLLLTREDT
jgi:hypothetical protein